MNDAIQLEIVNVGTSEYSDAPDGSTFAIDAAGQQYSPAYTATTAGPTGISKRRIR